MKVNNISNYVNYQTNIKAAKNDEAVKFKKYDVIEINKTGKADYKLNSIKKDIVAEIEKSSETREEKINRIKESLNNKTYNVNVEEILDKLFK